MAAIIVTVVLLAMAVLFVAGIDSAPTGGGLLQYTEVEEPDDAAARRASLVAGLLLPALVGTASAAAGRLASGGSTE